MNDWTGGYLADVEYAHAYNGELNPLRARLALLVAGLSVPAFDAACELGFGQGLSINLHAAASETRWCGTDFNPTQVGFARELGKASGADLKLFDEAFADFAHRPDLPDFDFIAMHGIWNWVSRDNQSVIADFIRRKLKVRGIVYMGYNVAPGWAALGPIRHLMAEHARLAGATGAGKLGSLKGALEFVEKFLATNPGFRRANPLVVEKFNGIKNRNANYLVHEYLNGHWQPCYFTDMVEAMGPAKIAYACPANYLEHYDAINLTADQWALLQTLPDGGLRQSTRDFMFNQQFRRDYWAKGAGRLTPLQQSEALRAERVVLVSHRPKVALRVTSALGEVNLHAPVYEPILDVLADCKVRTIGDVANAVSAQNITLAHVVEAVMVMASAGHIAPAQDEAAIARAAPHARRLNDDLIERARSSGDVGFLASPVTGGGIGVGRITQNFILAHRQGRTTPQELAEFAWHLLDVQGHRLVKDAKTLESADANVGALVPQAVGFVQEALPVLKALQVA